MFSERVVETGQGGMGSGVKNDQFSKSRKILVFFGLGGLPKNGLPLFSAMVWRFWFGPKDVRIYVLSERVVGRSGGAGLMRSQQLKLFQKQ